MEMTAPTEFPKLCLLFCPADCEGDAWQRLAAALDGGVDLVQWRDKSGTDRAHAPRAREICDAHGVPLVVNDDVDLARDLRCAGVHVGQDDATPAVARRAVGPERWVGVSTHDHGQIDAAVAAGADYVGFGPVHATATKGYATGVGYAALTAAVAHSAIPVVAIGGIDPTNIAAVVAAGARHVAVSAAILRAPDPRAAAAAIRGHL